MTVPTMTVATADGLPPDGPPPPTPTNNQNSSPCPLTSSPAASVPTLYNTLLRVDIHCSSNASQDSPLKQFLSDLLQNLQQVNNNNIILPIEKHSTLGSLTKESDIPSEPHLSQYVDGITFPNKTTNMIRFHIRIGTTLPLWQLKRKPSMYEWLNKGRIFLRIHGFLTTYDVTSAGFMSKLSPTMHHRDTVKALIDNKIKQKDLDIEIKLVPRNIPYDQTKSKQTTTAVEILVDRAYVNIIREILINMSQKNPKCFPTDTYFVPYPAHGILTQKLYYAHLRIHHQYINQLHSISITNVYDIKTEIMIPTANGNMQHTTMFEQAIIDSVKPNTQIRLFKSIETTKESSTHGKYLLLTTANLLKDAQIFLAKTLEQMSQTNPDNKFCIIKPMASYVNRTNHIVTSPHIQTYAQTLKNMLPMSITTTNTTNDWQHCSTDAISLYDKEYPALDEHKRTDDTITNDATASETFTSNALDELKNAYETKCEALQQQLLAQCKSMEDMKQQLTQSFEQKLQQFEHKMESEIMKTLETYDQHIKQVMNNIKDLMDKDRSHMKTMLEEQLQQIMITITGGSIGKTACKLGNISNRKTKTHNVIPNPSVPPEHMTNG